MSATARTDPSDANALTRSTRSDMTELRRLVRLTADEVRAGGTVTLRQLYYALTVRGILQKTEGEYKRLATITSVMRKSGAMPYEWLEDSTRVTYAPAIFQSAADALRALSARYAVSPWPEAECAVEIWLEKDALAGPVYDVTYDYCVPLRVQRGYASLSASYKAAKAIAARASVGQSTRIFYLRDYDPSGADAARASEKAVGDILESDFDIDRGWMDVAVMGVLSWQVPAWRLPTRPTKSSDSRSANFESSISVELDALPPAKLRELVTGAILAHLPKSAMMIKGAEESTTRAYLESLAQVAESRHGH